MRRLTVRRFTVRELAVVLIGILAVFLLSACEETAETGAQATENKSRQSNYERLVTSQPAGTMAFSPTRETKNFWIKTWDQKGKLSYVFISNADNVVTGYYVFEGLPVSYCTSLIPPYQIKDYRSGSGYGNAFTVPGPSVDGTFSSGGDCNTKYGKDAVSGTYVEFNVGMGQNYMLLDQPLPPQRLAEAKPMGFATLEDVKK